MPWVQPKKKKKQSIDFAIEYAYRDKNAHIFMNVHIFCTHMAQYNQRGDDLIQYLAVIIFLLRFLNSLLGYVIFTYGKEEGVTARLVDWLKIRYQSMEGNTVPRWKRPTNRLNIRSG